MKIVINRCFGGFSLSQDAISLYNKYSDNILRNGYAEVDRNDPDLVRVVEELGDKADGGCASLKVVEIPEDVSWNIDDYDGIEHIAEVHRTWS